LGRYGWPDVSIQFDKADGGALQEMKAYITSINGLDIELILEDMTAAGETWEAQVYVGLKKGSPIVISGPYDDTATTGSDAVFNPTGATGVSRSCVITWGGAKTTTFEALIQKYGRKPAKGQLHKYEVTIVPTGAIVDA
jgi:hypothetical protein